MTIQSFYPSMYIAHASIYPLNCVPRILESLPPLPRQHSAAIGCTKNDQPIGVAVHTLIALRTLNLSGTACTHVYIRWLDDVGLPQYKDSFLEARVDGRSAETVFFYA